MPCHSLYAVPKRDLALALRNGRVAGVKFSRIISALSGRQSRLIGRGQPSGLRARQLNTLIINIALVKFLIYSWHKYNCSSRTEPDMENAQIVAVVGLGYVGLPLAVEFGKKVPVVGFDIHQKRIDELKSGQDHTLEVSAEELVHSAQLCYSANLE